MYYKFSKSIFDNLILNGYHILTGDASQEVYNEKTKLIALEKQLGSNLYIVFLQNTLEYPMNELLEELVKINDYLWHLPTLKDFKQIVILNILPTISKNKNTSIDNLINTPSNIPDSFIYNVFWEIDLKNNKIIVGKNQPSKILGIEKQVTKAMEQFNNGIPVHPKGLSIIDEYKSIIVNCVKHENITFTPPYATFTLIGIMLMLVIYTEYIDPRSILSLGVSKNTVINHGEIYRLFTSIFTHGNIMHFLNNSLGLYIFGSRIERCYGRINMLLTFLLTAIIGNIVSIFLLPNVFSIGASGGIFGLIGFALCIVIFSDKMMFGFDFNTIAIMSVFMLLSSFLIENVNIVAHITGFIFGFIIALCFVFLNKHNNINKNNTNNKDNTGGI